MASQDVLKVNPIIKKIFDAGIEGEIVVFRGYIGAVDDRNVRLYSDLRLTTYLEIPAGEVLHHVPEPEDSSGAVKVFVRASAEVHRIYCTTGMAKHIFPGIVDPLPPYPGPLCEYLDAELDFVTNQIFKLYEDAIESGVPLDREELDRLKAERGRLKTAIDVWCNKGVLG